MIYNSLSNKWRPKKFSDFIGQERIIKIIFNSIKLNKLHHAYLLSGMHGIGKTTLARIFSKALNCEIGITIKPCEKCNSCHEINNGNSIDYIEMDAASNRGIEEIMLLLNNTSYMPINARFKIYMIDEIHMLTISAFNAMLKIIENPPKYIKFIFITTDYKKIPSTILSRCLQLNLEKISTKNIIHFLKNILKKEKIAYKKNALNLLANESNGSMRDALSLTEQAIAYSNKNIKKKYIYSMLKILDKKYLIKLLEALSCNNTLYIFKIANKIKLNGLSFSITLKNLSILFYKIALTQELPQYSIKNIIKCNNIIKFSKIFTSEQIQLFYQISIIGRNELILAPNEYTGFTMTLLRMISFKIMKFN